jgi:hypothetical protein
MADNALPQYVGESVIFGNNPNNDRVHARIAADRAKLATNAAAKAKVAADADAAAAKADADAAAAAAAAAGTDPKPLTTPPPYKPRT